MGYLNRETASLSEEIWKQIDEAAVSAARDMLTGRRFLDVEGRERSAATRRTRGHLYDQHPDANLPNKLGNAGAGHFKTEPAQAQERFLAHAGITV